jgi:protein-tyrosine phosphatase
MAAHRARQATPALLRAADLVLAMERAHVEAVVARVPQMRGRVFRLGHWEGVDVPDPYRQQRIAFEHVHALIERNLEHWLAHLGGQR